MKKISSLFATFIFLIISSVIIAGGVEITSTILPPPLPNCFSGFNIGLEGGLWMNIFNTDSAGIIDCIGDNCSINFEDHIGRVDFRFRNHFSNNGDANALTGAFGMRAGYGLVFAGKSADHWYLGIDGGVDFGNAGDRIVSTQDFNILIGFTLANPPFNLPFNVSDPALPGTATLQTIVSLNNLYTIAAKWGYLFSPQIMGYLKFGAAWSEISLDNSLALDILSPTLVKEDENLNLIFTDAVRNFFTARNNAEHTQLGFLLGAGIEYCLTDHFTVAAEYNYLDFDGVIVHHSFPTPLEFPDIDVGLNADPQRVDQINNLLSGLNVQTENAATDAKMTIIKLAVNYYFHSI